MPSTSLESRAGMPGSIDFCSATARISSLRGILSSNQEDFIMDANAYRIEYNHNSFVEEAYDTKSASELDSAGLIDTLNAARGLSEISDLGNVYVIPEVTKEVQQARKLISEKLSWFGQRIYNAEDEENTATINKIALEVFEMAQKMRNKEIKFNHELYSPILECVKLISEKYDNHPRYQNLPIFYQRKKEKLTEYLGTDEKLIATAFTKALIEKKKCSLISSDILLVKKFMTAYALLSCDEIGVLKELQQYNLKVYGWSQGIYRLKKTTFSLKPQKEFRLYIAGEEENTELKAKINNLLCNLNT